MFHRRRKPVNAADKALAESLFGSKPKKRKPARCLKCGQPTTRRLNAELGICQACEQRP
jgi:ribosomal protein L37AE/L43A